MKRCFTGSRLGMTSAQEKTARMVLQGTTALGHGGCDGSDYQAARIVRELCPDARIVCYQGPKNDRWQKDSGVDDEKRPHKPHLERNRDMVEDGYEELVATPPGMSLMPYGGTAYTVKYGRKVGIPIIIIWPDGSISREGF